MPPSRLLRPWLLLALATALLGAAIALVDLSPRVEGDFFFATDDPQLQASAAIGERFPRSPQILISAAPAGGDVGSEAYAERVGALSRALARLPGVTGVRSLTHGPDRPADVFASPLWRRLLVPEGGGEGAPEATYLLVATSPGAGGGGAETRELVRGVETVLERAAGAGEPALTLHVSGVPWVMELIRRHLVRDLALFSAVGLALFTLVVAVVYRDPWIVLGVLTACLTACAATLLLLAVLGVPVGVLTANIATIVFVLTLSHLVYMTANRPRGGDQDRVGAAVRATLEPSFWCMTTTLCGFVSLRFADARPLRELGTAGAVGTAVAMAVAYAVYPAFLRAASLRAAGAEGGGLRPRRDPFGGRRLSAWTAALGLLVLAAAPGLARLDTDPPLTAYFEPGSDIATGLEMIDRGGGSSPLDLVVHDAAGGDDGRPPTPFDRPAVLDRLAVAQERLDADPATGTVLSLPVLVAEARRVNPMAGFLPLPNLLDVLESPRYDAVARTFLSADRTRALVLLRMRESALAEPGAPSRGAVVERLQGVLRDQGLEVELTGGLYHLQGALGELVARSLWTGLGALGLLFAFVAAVVARRPRSALAMLVCLAATPVVLFGLFGWLRLPVDLISSPAANVAVAMGIDSMIHLVTAARRLRRGGLAPWDAWTAARGRLWRPVTAAAALLAAGFGIFLLSSFPPTQRFGLAVVVGLAAATAATLVALPRLAAGWSRT